MHSVVGRWLVPLLVWAMASQASAQNLPRVELSAVTRGPMLEEVPLTGSVTALRRSDISVSIAGLVLTRQVDVGDRVAAGDTLLTLDAELSELALMQARAQQQQAESELSEARRVLDEARSVGAGTNIATTEVNRRQSEVATAEAALAGAQAALAIEQARLRRHRITAPFAGVISSRRADAGEWVQPGTPVFTLIDTDTLALDFQVPQQAFPKLNDSSVLHVSTAGATRDNARPAAIVNWLPVNSGEARTFLLRARPEPGFNLNPGMSLEGTLTVQRDSDALSVPRDALNRYPDGRVTVWVAESGGDGDTYSVSEQRVMLAGTAGNRVYIESGLGGDELIVSRGNESLRQGIDVERVGGAQR